MNRKKFQRFYWWLALVAGVVTIISSTFGIVQVDKYIKTPTFLEGLSKSSFSIRKYVQSSEYQAEVAQHKADAKEIKNILITLDIIGGGVVAWSTYSLRKAAIMRKQHE